MFVCMSICLSIIVCLHVRLCACPSLCLSVYLSVYLSLCLSVSLSICLPVRPLLGGRSVSCSGNHAAPDEVYGKLSIYLSVRPPVRLCICPSVYP
jgi:hypothetical protein